MAISSVIVDIVKSWAILEGVNSLQEIMSWIEEKNKNLVVKMKQIGLCDCASWHLDSKDYITNKTSSFFTIGGLKLTSSENQINQPIIHQDEIGYLGIICKRINGVIHFLMQAKIEPGNINKVQISPTIQATKSNFEQKHGGKKPDYLDFFMNGDESIVVVDQIQSEQAGRFWKKRNRNIILYTEKNIPILSSHKWMTLGQIKELMKVDNLVNMDSRTVLSCIPFSLFNIDNRLVNCCFKNKLLCNSIFNSDDIEINEAFVLLNNYKMFSNRKIDFCSLNELDDWKFDNKEFKCLYPSNFKVVFYNIEIDGREVKKWDQPLFEANGSAIFVLFAKDFSGKYKFLIRLAPEVGAFDKAEFGPTIQNEYLDASSMPSNEIEVLFAEHIKSHEGILNDVMLSEEGGRFFQEQNRNVIIELNENELEVIPPGYIWLDYKTLNHLVQFNNVLNIQLRNLLSLLEA